MGQKTYERSYYPANWNEVEKQLQDIKSYSVNKMLNESNINVDDTLFSECFLNNTILYEYIENMTGNYYDKYFSEFLNDKRNYMIEDLLKDITNCNN